MKKLESNKKLKTWHIALIYVLLTSACGPIGVKEGISIHDKLVQNDCYEIENNIF